MLKVFYVSYDEAIGDYKDVPVGELNGSDVDIAAITAIAEAHAIEVNPKFKVDMSYTELPDTLWVCLVMADGQRIGIDEAYNWKVE